MSKTKQQQQDETVYQIHLCEFGMSGRGVRVRQLEPDVVKKVESDAGKLVGMDGTLFDLNQTSVHEGMCRMVAEVTEEPVRGTRPTEDGKKVPRTLADEDVVWRPVTLQEMKAGLRKLFTSKDVAALEHLYQRLHTVSQFEVELLMGKALQVSAPD